MSDIKEIILSNGIAIIDDADYGHISQYKWCKDKNNYVLRSEYIGYSNGRGKNKTISMHREIMGFPQNHIIDHINGNTLDNRRCNLRIANKSKNAQNQKKQSGCSSKYKGVTWHRGECKWRAQIQLNGKKVLLGRFFDEESAAIAYNQAAIQQFGEFSLLNKIGV